jgi:hypothetical protein
MWSDFRSYSFQHMIGSKQSSLYPIRYHVTLDHIVQKNECKTSFSVTCIVFRQIMFRAQLLTSICVKQCISFLLYKSTVPFYFLKSFLFSLAKYIFKYVTKRNMDQFQTICIPHCVIYRVSSFLNNFNTNSTAESMSITSSNQSCFLLIH